MKQLETSRPNVSALQTGELGRTIPAAQAHIVLPHQAGREYRLVQRTEFQLDADYRRQLKIENPGLEGDIHRAPMKILPKQSGPHAMLGQNKARWR